MRHDLVVRNRARLIGFSAAEVNGPRRFVVEPPGRKPALIPLNDVFAFPDYDALYDSRGRRIDYTKRNYVPTDIDGTESTRARVGQNDLRHNPEIVPVPSAFDVRHEPLLYLGVFWNHFGHFLMDSMSRMWALKEDVGDRRPLFLSKPPAAARAAGYSRAVIDALDLKDEDVRGVQRPTLLRDVLAPEPSMQHAFRIYGLHDRAHMLGADRIHAGRAGEGFRGRSVYLSRSKLPDRLRRVRGEEDLEDRLRRNGFDIVHPELLSMEDQVALFLEADHIAGTIGSAFHTVLFAPKDRALRLSVLTWEKINSRYLMVDAIKAHDVTYAKCCTIGDVDARQRIGDVTVDVEAALDAILL